jgi:two-component system chemotaxis response regulator CheB
MPVCNGSDRALSKPVQFTAPIRVTTGVEESFEQPLFPGCHFDLVVLAASLGGVPALKRVIGELPGNFPCAVAVVQHIASTSSMLPQLFGWRAVLPVCSPRDGDRLRAGTVYVAPPGRHLIISPARRFALAESEKVNFVRPAADPLLQTASRAFESRVLAVIFSGLGRDGAEGVRAVKRHGGTVLAQEPATAEHGSMPEMAIRTGAVDLVIPLRTMSHAIVSIAAVSYGMRMFGLPRNQVFNTVKIPANVD